MQLIIELLQRDKIKAAWLVSPFFFQDLEKLYALHLPTNSEWAKFLQVVYHPLLSNTEPNKVKYEKNFKRLKKNFNKH